LRRKKGEEEWQTEKKYARAVNIGMVRGMINAEDTPQDQDRDLLAAGPRPKLMIGAVNLDKPRNLRDKEERELGDLSIKENLAINKDPRASLISKRGNPGPCPCVILRGEGEEKMSELGWIVIFGLGCLTCIATVMIFKGHGWGPYSTPLFCVFLLVFASLIVIFSPIRPEVIGPFLSLLGGVSGFVLGMWWKKK
jgi:hypothetical protein